MPSGVYPRTKEHIEKVRQYRLGRKHTAEAIEKMRLAYKLHKPFLGKKHTEESKKRMSIAQKEIAASQDRSGPKSPSWRGGITSVNTAARLSVEQKLWRHSVLARDGFTCQKCEVYSGVLNAHHILNFSEAPQLRVAIDNGITLCRMCHKLFHKEYGRKYNTRNQLEIFLGNLER